MTHLSIPKVSRRYLRHGMLPQLAALEAVLRLGSATRAAEVLCMAQPTLSGQLRKLSQALGVRLFEIQGKQLVPTDAALVLLQTAREVLSSFERCEQVLAAMRAASDLGAGAAGQAQTAPAELAQAARNNRHSMNNSHRHAAG